MNKILIKDNYSKIIKELQDHNKAYYEKDSPVISDQKYDTLKKKIFDLENKYEFLNSKQSPSISVGFKPSKNFKKIKHKVPMLSLSNAFNAEDLKHYNANEIEFLLHPESYIPNYYNFVSRMFFFYFFLFFRNLFSRNIFFKIFIFNFLIFHF